MRRSAKVPLEALVHPDHRPRARNVRGQAILYGDRITDEMDAGSDESDYVVIPILSREEAEDSAQNHEDRIEELRSEMMLAAEGLEFEKAARLRDKLKALEHELMKQERRDARGVAGGDGGDIDKKPAKSKGRAGMKQRPRR